MFDENLFLLITYLIALCGVFAVLDLIAELLERHFPSGK